MNYKLDKNNSVSLQGQVAEIITEKIRQGEWGEGDKIPSERKLCEIFDISRNTARSAVKELCAQGILESATGQGTFVARSLKLSPLRRRKTGNIGYLLCKPKEDRRLISDEPFYFALLSNLRQQLSISNFQLLFSYYDANAGDEENSLRQFLSTIDGLVIHEADSIELIEMLNEAQLPYVLIQPDIRIDGCDVISFDMRQGAFDAVDFLLKCGHRRIAMIRGPLDDPGAEVRVEGYKAALASVGLNRDDEMIAGGDGWFRANGLAAAEKLLADYKDLSAIFCSNDALAAGVLAAVSKAGVRVPEDLSVVGFDDSIIAVHTNPPLSSVKLDMEQLAVYAAKQLLGRLENPDIITSNITLPTLFVKRESTQQIEII